MRVPSFSLPLPGRRESGVANSEGMSRGPPREGEGILGIGAAPASWAGIPGWNSDLRSLSMGGGRDLDLSLAAEALLIAAGAADRSPGTAGGMGRPRSLRMKGGSEPRDLSWLWDMGGMGGMGGIGRPSWDVGWFCAGTGGTLCGAGASPLADGPPKKGGIWRPLSLSPPIRGG